MKKFLSALISILLCFLCACTPQTKTEEKSEITLSPYSMPQATGETVALYYPTKDFLGSALLQQRRLSANRNRFILT